MNLRNRIGRLEQTKAQPVQMPLIVRTIVRPNGTNDGAVMARTQTGTLRREHDEPEGAFLARAQQAHSHKSNEADR